MHVPRGRNRRLAARIKNPTAEDIRRMSPTARAEFERGNESERKAAEALILLCSRGTFDHWFQVERGSKQDVEHGIDFWVFTNPVSAMPLQVKSSVFHQEEHYRIHGHRVSCVVVHPNMSIVDLAESIFDELLKTAEPHREFISYFQPTIGDVVKAS